MDHSYRSAAIGSVREALRAGIYPATAATANINTVAADNASGSAYFDDCLLNPLAWNIVWNDEFDGTTINSAKWVICNNNERAGLRDRLKRRDVYIELDAQAFEGSLAE